MKNLYFDNGATSFPKPPSVARAMTAYLNEIGGSYGRASHGRALKSTSVVENCRDLLAQKFGFSRPENIAFGANATEGLNLVIRGFRFNGGEVLISPLEHNSVARPLKFLEEQGILKVRTLPHFKDGLIDVEKIETGPMTELVIINHMSNVNGLIQPVGKIKKKIGTVPILVDGAQSAGHIPVDLDGDGIDFFAFTGHKCLLGPTGTGGVCIRNPELVSPLKYGGTGSNSESLHMPSHSPDRFEAGTPNIAGIFGLEAALNETIQGRYSIDTFYALISEIDIIPGVILYKAESIGNQGHLFSFVIEGKTVSDTACELQYEYGIETRSGLHCAPIAHETLGSSPHGSVRIGLSPYHKNSDLDYLLDSIKKISQS